MRQTLGRSDGSAGRSFFAIAFKGLPAGGKQPASARDRDSFRRRQRLTEADPLRRRPRRAARPACAALERRASERPSTADRIPNVLLHSLQRGTRCVFFDWRPELLRTAALTAISTRDLRTPRAKARTPQKHKKPAHAARRPIRRSKWCAWRAFLIALAAGPVNVLGRCRRLVAARSELRSACRSFRRFRVSRPGSRRSLDSRGRPAHRATSRVSGMILGAVVGILTVLLGFSGRKIWV